MNLISHFSNARNAQETPPGTVFFTEGDAVGPMYVLLGGAARIFLGHQVIEIASPGSIFGEMALIDESPRSATAVATADTKLAVIDQHRFLFLVQETPMFALQVMSSLAERLRAADSS